MYMAETIHWGAIEQKEEGLGAAAKTHIGVAQ